MKLWLSLTVGVLALVFVRCAHLHPHREARSGSDSGSDSSEEGGGRGGSSSSSDDVPVNCIFEQTCNVVPNILATNADLFGSISSALAQIRETDAVRSARILLDQALQGFLQMVPTDPICLMRNIALTGPLRLESNSNFFALVASTDGRQLSNQIAADLEFANKDITLVFEDLESFVEARATFQIDSDGMVVPGSFQRQFVTTSANNGAVTFTEPTPFNLVFPATVCTTSMDQTCGPGLVDPTDPPAVTIPDLPSVLETDVGTVAGLLGSMRSCPT